MRRKMESFNIDVRRATTVWMRNLGIQEGFVEAKLLDLSHDYDFVSARAGIQSFNSDFRGFIFSDQEPGLRIFGNFQNNRYQYNLAYFAMLEKDTNSGLNTLRYRHQQVMIANLYRQDFYKAGLYHSSQLSLRQRRSLIQVRHQQLPGPSGSDRRCEASLCTRVLLRAYRRRPLWKN